MNNFEYIAEQLDYAQKQLDSADNVYLKEVWGNRVGMLIAAICNLKEANKR